MNFGGAAYLSMKIVSRARRSLRDSNVIGGPANELQVVVRGTINMNPGVEPYYGTPDTLGVPPMILRDPSLRVFHANAVPGVDPRYWYYDPPVCCFCPRGGKYRLQGPRDGTKGVGRGVTYLSMKIVSRARRSLRDSNRHVPICKSACANLFFCLNCAVQSDFDHCVVTRLYSTVLLVAVVE